jgi:hypothetical protein
MWLAAAFFVVGAAFGGYLVYHGGAGIEGDLLKPGLHEEHHHHEGEEYPVQPEDNSGHESSHQDH